MAMTNLDSIFASYPDQGFQDIWFSALEPNDVARLFNYACQMYGNETEHKNFAEFTDSGLDVCSDKYKLHDISYSFAPLIIDKVVLEGVAIRIEDDKLAIDFDSGLEYWNSTRQTAFVRWLRELYCQVPNARLEWAHEGCDYSPSIRESELLRLAVVGHV